MREIKTDIRLMHERSLQICQGDITGARVDAIVNAANQGSLGAFMSAAETRFKGEQA